MISIHGVEEKREWVREIFEEALEDLGLRRAIEEGAQSETVDRSEIFRLLSA